MSFPQVELNTNKGRIVLELNTEKAPKTKKNTKIFFKNPSLPFSMTALFSTVSLMVS